MVDRSLVPDITILETEQRLEIKNFEIEGNGDRERRAPPQRQVKSGDKPNTELKKAPPSTG